MAAAALAFTVLFSVVAGGFAIGVGFTRWWRARRQVPPTTLAISRRRGEEIARLELPDEGRSTMGELVELRKFRDSRRARATRPKG